MNDQLVEIAPREMSQSFKVFKKDVREMEALSIIKEKKL